MLQSKNQQKNQQKEKVLKKINMQQIIILIGLTEISLKKFWPLLTGTNLITRIKYANFSILTLETWLIILEIMELVKYLLKKV